MRLIPWAVAFATALLSSRAVATGQMGDRPVPAAMWPPHRPHPTPPRPKNRLAYRTKLVGAKGLRP